MKLSRKWLNEYVDLSLSEYGRQELCRGHDRVRFQGGSSPRDPEARI
ncbi:MAG: hypothetical protein V8T45_07785 [Oscillospiraceae bacterium]